MPNPKNKEPNAIELLAMIELMLSKLSQDHEAATYHRNSVIDECLSFAQEELLEAMNLILRGDAENWIRLCKIAWLRIDFGRKLLDADAVEHLLGESEYLELAESEAPAETLIRYYFFQLEHLVLKLYSAFHKSTVGE